MCADFALFTERFAPHFFDICVAETFRVLALGSEGLSGEVWMHRREVS